MTDMIPGRQYTCSKGHHFYVVKDLSKLTDVERTAATPKCPYMTTIGTSDSPKGVACNGKVEIIALPVRTPRKKIVKEAPKVVPKARRKKQS